MKKTINKTKKQGQRDFYGKGWVVKTFNSGVKGPGYVACIFDKETKKYKYVALKRSETEAIKTAISEAFKNNVLNWHITRRWLYENNIAISFDEILDTDWRNYRCGRGWFIKRQKTKVKDSFSYSCKIGPHYDDVKCIGAKSSLKLAAKTVITAAKNEKYYNKAATIYWLHQNNLSELIEIA